MKKLLPLLTLFALTISVSLPLLAQDQQWTLDSSTLSYHVSHPVHQIDGTSHAALGKGVCHAGQCDFLIAAPVKSFETGDSNRDLHMIQVTRGAQFPIVSVRLRIPTSAILSPTVDCDIDIQFAGQTAHYQHLQFQQTIQGNEHRITGTIPSTLTDFKMIAPSFLTVPLHNEMPVKVELTWHPS
jgi:hypothetical protein